MDLSTSRAPISAAMSWLLGIASAAMLLVPIPLMFLVTLSFDEAWVIGGVTNIALQGTFGMGSTIGSSSTGGVYLLGELVLAAAFGKHLWLARLFVYSTLLLFVREVWLLAGHFAQNRRERLLAVSLALGVPGLLYFSAVAHGTTPALWLLLRTLRHWSFGRAGKPLWRHATEAGLLLGACVATRLDFALALPALLLASSVSGPQRAPQLRRATISIAVAAVVLGLNFSGMALLTGQSLSENTRAASYATGIHELLAGMHPNLFSLKTIALQESYPLGLLMVAAVIAIPRQWARSAGDAASEALRTLLCFALLSVAVWLGSPKQLYRYLLPGLVLTQVALSLSLLPASERLRRSQRHAVLLSLSIWSLGQLGAELVRNIRIGLHGDSDNVVAWFSKERSPSGLYSFLALRTQRMTASYLERLPPETATWCIGPDYLDMIYLTGREVRSIETLAPGRLDTPTLILYRPTAMGNDLNLSYEAQTWFRENCVVEQVFGTTIVYRLTGSLPSDPGLLRWREML